jgi:hypothetical protein
MDHKTKEYQREWRRRNQQWVKEYRERNREKIAKQTRERYLRNKTHSDAVRKKWYLKNKSRIIANLRAKKETLEGKLYQWKLSAKRRRIGWNLVIEQVRSLPMVCYYTGLPLTMEVGKVNTMSIDRRDSSRPYEFSNVVPCCSMVNAMKQDFEENEFIEMCKQITNHQSNE